MELNSGAADPATDSTASHDLQMNRAVAFLLEESEEDMEGEVHIDEVYRRSLVGRRLVRRCPAPKPETDENTQICLKYKYKYTQKNICFVDHECIIADH